MPLNKNLKKVLIIGSGSIVIGQAAEFDYAGTQACRALREEGLSVVLVNSNPATIMTDTAMADAVYIEPLTLTVIKRIIEKEKPDSLLSTLGGQTGLTLSMQLAKEGFLEKHNVQLLGARVETIDNAEDRLRFKQTMQRINQPCIPSEVVTDVPSALTFAQQIGYPVIVRPAFTLGGSGGGIADDAEALTEICANGLALSPIHQVLIERSVAGWKEIEFEVMRDAAGNTITVCSMENLDPVGVHTGDSIVIAPAVTLADKEYQMLRSASLDIIKELEIEGGCNVQFALHPDSFEYAVIEVNPRVSRSSALASKATGYPIAKIAAKLAIGYTLPELKNAVTGVSSACFEPALDYVVVKLPKFPFDKFVYAKRTLGTQMKATGEVMAIGTSFEMALMKAVRGAAISHTSLMDREMRAMDDATLIKKLHDCDDRRIFAVYEALTRGVGMDEVFEITRIDRWFLGKIKHLADLEKCLKNGLDDALYLEAKRAGYPDAVIEQLSGKEHEPRFPVYKMVDTCAAEFDAKTPYFYATYDDENEAAQFIARNKTDKKTVIVFGSGPIRIGQGIEFDYASVHCVWALKKLGYDVVIVNNNPETVSTDFDTADRLYFEPPTPEDVRGIVETEKPYGAVVAFGGQTAINLTKSLVKMGVNILGTSQDGIDLAEDRERFEALLEKLEIKRPQGRTVMTMEEALVAANEIGYPVLLRPSYVLGGQNMIIAFHDDDVKEYMAIILTENIENPVLIDQYLSGTELEIDAICDGEDVLIPGVMEHIERAGVHSGDSIAVYPTYNVDDEMLERITDCSRRLALSVMTRGLVNIQYLIYGGELYVIEVNPRSSRTIPYISKVTGVPMVELATRAMLGEKLKDMGYGTGRYKISPYVAVKAPVFSFEKLAGVDTQLGPEMKSTGEVLGIAGTFAEALYKALLAAGYRVKRRGGVLMTVRKTDHPEIADTAQRFHELGFTIYATPGTARAIANTGVPVIPVEKIHQNEKDNAMTILSTGKIDYVVSTSAKGRVPTRDSVRIRRKAVEQSIPCLTSIDTANALALSIKSRYSEVSTELVDICHMKTEKTRHSFAKMQGTGNDYIYFDCMTQLLDSPEAISVRFSDRHYGIGGDGIVEILPSKVADARMRMYNSDGTEGLMAGNAIRCVAKFLYDHGFVDKMEMTIETASGVKRVWLHKRNGEVQNVTVDMGKALLTPSKIPVLLDGEKVVNRLIDVAGGVHVTCVNMGNPHAVVFTDNVDIMDVAEVGAKIEHSALFPERVNVEFVRVLGESTLRLRTWERGNGETQACGTGACAAVVAAVENGLCRMNKDITVKLLGGDLVIRVTEDTVYLTGDAATIYEGTVVV